MTDILNTLYSTIQDRKATPRPDSYTTSLFEKGIDEITKKVGEEAVEVVIAAQNQSRERLISELADLTYHTLVLLVQTGVTLDEVGAELARRHR